MVNKFLPISKDDLRERGWDEVDIIIVTGDAYVDHPSYGAAVIGRVLEAEGFKVGVIAQPGWHRPNDFLALGKPRLFFGVTSGNTDSMIANYTANKRPRDEDGYSPGARTGMRPDRAALVYTAKIREIFGSKMPVILGGIEASLRRLAHYDYWDNKVRRSILLDSRADMVIYGMGEKQILEAARRLDKGEPIASLSDIPGTTVIRGDLDSMPDTVIIPSFEEVSSDKAKFNEAFKKTYLEMDPAAGKPVAQKHANRYVVQLPPPKPLSQKDLDRIYDLPYTRKWHPVYDKKGGVKALETVRFSITSHRGCPGECSFCGLYFHQGRIVQSRSARSVMDEASSLAKSKDFSGTITDIGGPTSNLYMSSCSVWERGSACSGKKCIYPSKCPNLKLGYDESLDLLRKIAAIPGVKHVFLASGFRYDLLADDYADKYLEAVCKDHISGQMKVAPEHVSEKVLRLMNKPSIKVYDKFLAKFRSVNARLDKTQYLVNYFVTSHPGSDMKDALLAGLYLAANRLTSEQIQDFIPIPMTLSAAMYFTGAHPFTGEKVHVPSAFTDRKTQRAFLQRKGEKNRKLVHDALRKLGALDQMRKLYS
ncbi:MAG: YgiQ family radical SAM protein [Candidatus Omnitrophica bacterium]|nr:YgiQ family radical SAM protein [Candidatus Omnitrophota bacterium]